MNLPEFLLARLAEYERDIAEVTSTYFDAPMSEAQMWADLEAKRRIVAAHPIDFALSAYERSWGKGLDYGCTVCHDFDGITTGDGYCDTLRALAMPYADHPDYDEEWSCL